MSIASPQVSTRNNRKYPTHLGAWLESQGLTPTALAQRCGVSPRAIYNLLDERDKFSRDILRKVSLHTGLSIDALLSTEETDYTIQVEDSRISAMIGDICSHLHDSQKSGRLRKYVHPNFRCFSPHFKNPRTGSNPISWDEMLAANKPLMDRRITIVPLSSQYISFDGTETDSRSIIVFLRSIEIDAVPSARYEDTCLILKLDKTLDEMSIVETPKIRGWWWCNIPKSLEIRRSDTKLGENEIDLMNRQ